MILIRSLKTTEIPEAMRLKIDSWTEELAGKAENTLILSEEINFWSRWVSRGKEFNDIRLLLGAFENGELLGLAASNIAKYDDIPVNGIELNLLAVKPKHRGRGISIRLILYILNFYQCLGATKAVIYSHHYAPSNGFYAKFGAELLRKELQEDGKLEVDVFIADIHYFKWMLEKSLLKY
ncbi:GNAT family N-acetyltransferase [Clostridium sp. Marseille-P299]|uniref:GNAT family N-acetyltransferase n=1 Tax=Clostridium sp. Marseille-P299 TaxID=1805477 RepID=UPI00082CC855|nr:GNAT family N-acetyltransferase [Clostridium sp. Marseille-P299]